MTDLPTDLTERLADIRQFLTLAELRIYPTPDKPNSDWAILKRAISSLEELSRLKAERFNGWPGIEARISEFVRDYEYRDPDHTPSAAERSMLDDFGHALLYDLAESGQLSRLKAGEGWQDISTAPKDGTWFLGWAESDQSPYRVSWGRPRDGKLSWCTKFAGFVDGYITHWMPLLPPAPGARP